MTVQQAALLKWLRKWFETHAEAPSYRIIAEGMGWSTPSMVHRAMQILEREGYVTHRHGCARTLTLTAKGRGEAPLLDAVRALIVDGIISEDESTGRAVVDMNRLGTLELALKGDGPRQVPAVAAE